MPRRGESRRRALQADDVEAARAEVVCVDLERAGAGAVAQPDDHEPRVAVVVVLGAIAGSLLDFVLKAQIAGSSNGVLRSLALYYTVTNVVTAVVQIVFGGALIARLGVPRSIAALPLAVVSFGTAALAVPAMWSARSTPPSASRTPGSPGSP